MVLAFAAACESGPAVSDRVLQSASARAAGAELFAANCAICHGPRADGRGVRRAGFDTAAPSFRSRAWRDSTSPAKIVEVIRQGKKPTSMPAWPGLSDEQVGELVAYLWSLAEEPAP